MTDALHDKAVGTAHEVIGQGKAAVGEATGDLGLQAEGTTEQVQGGAEKVIGEVKQGAHNLGEEIKAGVSDLLHDTENALHHANHPAGS